MLKRLVPLLALALVTAACSASTPTGTPEPDAAGSPTASRSADADPTTTDTAEPEPSDTTSAEPSTPSSPQPSPGEGNGTDELKATPPQPGTYRYRQDGATTAGALTFEDDTEGTLEVRPASGSGKVLTQTQLREFSDNASTEQTLVFDEQRGVFLTATTTRFFTSTFTCDLEAPVLVIKGSPVEGESWNDAGTCDGHTVTVRGSFAKTEVRTVGGQNVETLKLRFTIVVDGPDVEQRTTSTMWVSPAHSLVVRQVSHSKGSSDGQDFTQDRTEDLISLSPA